MNNRNRITSYEFGEFRVDTRQKLVFRHGEIVPLTPKAVETLLALLSGRTGVCEKDELMKAVWPDAVVEENSLVQNVSQLRKALGDGNGESVIRTIPKRGYRFVADVREWTEDEGASPEVAARDPSSATLKPVIRAGIVPFWVVGALCAAAAIPASLYVARHVFDRSDPVWGARPLTSYPGGQYEPAFSPDGKQVAFVWDGEKQDNFDIYLKLVEGGMPLRLTTNPAGEGSPAWSPDGRSIAFVRYSEKPGESGCYMIPALGGPERKIGDLAPVPHIFDRHLDWSPDGKFLAVVDKTDQNGAFSIFLLSVETGERRRITTPPAGWIGDTGPAFSRDGRTIAFKRTSSAGINDIYVVSRDGGEPKRVTSWNGFSASHCWTANGRELIVSFGNALWRVPVMGGKTKPILPVAPGTRYLAVSGAGRYLAYSRWYADSNIWKVRIGAGEPRVVVNSTWVDTSAQFSPDGGRIAFRSNRSGDDEIWASDSSGRNALQLTSFHGPLTGTPRWSPDGKHLAFDSRPGGFSDIYTVPAMGGAVRRITAGRSDNSVPSWSRDGRWIYFASNRTGSWQVWKIAITGGAGEGEPKQVTRHGGFTAFESIDGRTLYYAKGPDAPGLWSVAVGGGEETPVMTNFKAGLWGLWTVAARGIYFIDSVAPRHGGLMLYSFEKQSVTRVENLPKEPPFGDSGFDISRDGQWALYTQVDHSGSDIMLVDNFR